MIKECWECDYDSCCPSYNDENITPSNCKWLKESQYLGTAWLSEDKEMKPKIDPTIELNLTDLDKLFLKGMNRLENYGYYALRCLNRVGIYPQPSDFACVDLKTENRSFGMCVVYPLSAVKDNTIENPMFFYGFLIELNLKNLEHILSVKYYEEYNEMIK